MEHRQAVKTTGTYLENYLELSERDGKIHPSINTIGGRAKTLFESGGAFGVRTGRMSMSDPNLQNVPVRTKEGKKIRNCFQPFPELNFWAKCDFDQIEMRVLAHLTQDPGLIKAFNSPDDFFVEMARQIFRDGTITKEDNRRQPVKNGMYAKVYGAGTDKFAWTANMRRDDGSLDLMAASEFLHQLDLTYPGIRLLANRVEAEGRANGASNGSDSFIRSPLTNRKHTCDSGKEYALLNYMIQGTAGEILKMKMIECDAAGLGEYMTIPVHDEIDMDIPLKDRGEVIGTLYDIMNDETMISVPVTSTISVGNRWGNVVDI
jgi:DNA polymerase-1